MRETLCPSMCPTKQIMYKNNKTQIDHGKIDLKQKTIQNKQTNKNTKKKTRKISLRFCTKLLFDKSRLIMYIYQFNSFFIALF